MFPKKPSAKTLSRKIKGENLNSDSLPCRSRASLITGGGEQFCDWLIQLYQHGNFHVKHAACPHHTACYSAVLPVQTRRPWAKRSAFFSSLEQDRCLIKMFYVGFRIRLQKKPKRIYKHTHILHMYTHLTSLGRIF